MTKRVFFFIMMMLLTQSFSAFYHSRANNDKTNIKSQRTPCHCHCIYLLNPGPKTPLVLLKMDGGSGRNGGKVSWQLDLKFKSQITTEPFHKKIKSVQLSVC